MESLENKKIYLSNIDDDSKCWKILAIYFLGEEEYKYNFIRMFEHISDGSVCKCELCIIPSYYNLELEAMNLLLLDEYLEITRNDK